jgi:DNA modification methylase
MLHSLDTADKPDAPEPEEPPEEPESRFGEVYELGPHRLHCGDSMDAAFWSNYRIDLVVTDPPYCSGGTQEANRTIGSVGVRGQAGQYKAIERDNLTSEGLSALLEKVVRVIQAKRAVYCFTDWRQLQNVRKTIEPLGYTYKGLLVWDKGGGGLGWPYMHAYELVFCGVRDWKKAAGGGGLGDLLRYKRTRNELHTTQKPVDLMQALIAATPGKVVADPFAGSGTTLLAAAMENRTAIVCEFDPGYCDVIRRRWTAWADQAGVDAGPGALR